MASHEEGAEQTSSFGHSDHPSDLATFDSSTVCWEETWHNFVNVDDEQPSEAQREISSSNTLVSAEITSRDPMSHNESCTGNDFGHIYAPSDPMAWGISFSSSSHIPSSFLNENLPSSTGLIRPDDIHLLQGNDSNLNLVSGLAIQDLEAANSVLKLSEIPNHQFGEFVGSQPTQDVAPIMNTELQTMIEDFSHRSFADLRHSPNLNEGLSPGPAAYSTLLPPASDLSTDLTPSVLSQTEDYNIQRSSIRSISLDPSDVREQTAEPNSKKKRKKYTEEGREKSKRVREAGACVRCRIYKEPVWFKSQRDKNVLKFL